MKMLAPAILASLNIANVEYTRGEDDMFDIAHDHVGAATVLGLKPYDPEADSFVPGVLLEAHQDHRDLEIADLKARLALAEAAAAPSATLTAEDPADTSGDTSSSAGGTPPTEDAMAGALALEPKFDEMDRDGMVEWLKGVGVVVPANISKDNARKAVDEAIADYHSGQKD